MQMLCSEIARAFVKGMFGCFERCSVVISGLDQAFFNRYANLFVEMCNVVGVRAVKVVGDCITSDGGGPHAWCALQLPNQSWFVRVLFFALLIKSSTHFLLQFGQVFVRSVLGQWSFVRRLVCLLFGHELVVYR
jgi:hypothetical protein